MNVFSIFWCSCVPFVLLHHHNRVKLLRNDKTNGCVQPFSQNDLLYTFIEFVALCALWKGKYRVKAPFKLQQWHKRWTSRWMNLVRLAFSYTFISINNEKWLNDGNAFAYRDIVSHKPVKIDDLKKRVKNGKNVKGHSQHFSIIFFRLNQ